MKIEKIAYNKLKITLEYQDMLKWDLDYSKMPDSMPGPGDLFWDILRIAEEETGIVFENCKLTVEAMQRAGGAFVMFITKGELENERKTSPLQKKYVYKRKSGQQKKQQSAYIYKFKEIEDVCSYCKVYAVYGDVFEGRNSLYKYKENYYLHLEIPFILKDFEKDLENSLREFAVRIPYGEIFLGKLKEYGVLIVENNCIKKMSGI